MICYFMRGKVVDAVDLKLPQKKWCFEGILYPIFKAACTLDVIFSEWNLMITTKLMHIEFNSILHSI